MPVVTLPAQPQDSIPEQLRALADRIEAGEFGEVHSASWVLDVGGQVETGIFTPVPLALHVIGPTAHLMLAMGMRKLEG